MKPGTEETDEITGDGTIAAVFTGVPRPRQYANDAERQRAHRQRQAETTTRVDRTSLEELLAAVDTTAAGGSLARRVRTGTPDALLRNLAHHFRTVVAATGD